MRRRCSALSVWKPKRKLIAHQCWMLWSIDSYQNRVSADQYHLTVPRAQVSTYRNWVFFEVIRWQFTSFKWSQAQVYFFQGFISNMLCLCHYGPALLEFWFQTDLGHENSASFLKYRGGSPFLTMVTRWSRSTSNFYALIGQNLTGEFMRKIRDLKIQRRDGNENVS